MDEAPMSSKYAFEVASNGLRKIVGSADKNDPRALLPFGGKISIQGGDFRQCTPIKERGIRPELVDLSLKRSELWKYYKVFKLKKNMRVDPEELEYAEYILQVFFLFENLTIFRWAMETYQLMNTKKSKFP